MDKDNQSQVTRCLRCGRPLKTREARLRGYGTHCFKLRQKEISNCQYNIFTEDPNYICHP